MTFTCRDHDTVGACAMDRHGNVACATSTGGITAKRPGRVGDSPLIGKKLVLYYSGQVCKFGSDFNFLHGTGLLRKCPLTQRCWLS